MKIGSFAPLLQVFDLPTSVAFYRDILGFEMVDGSESWWCMLQRGEATLMLNTAYEDDDRPLVPDPARVAAHADTSLYFDTPVPDQVYAHLIEKGWPATPPVITSYGMRVVSTKDPDGYELCFLGPVNAA